MKPIRSGTPAKSGHGEMSLPLADMNLATVNKHTLLLIDPVEVTLVITLETGTTFAPND